MINKNYDLSKAEKCMFLVNKNDKLLNKNYLIADFESAIKSCSKVNIDLLDILEKSYKYKEFKILVKDKLKKEIKNEK